MTRARGGVVAAVALAVAIGAPPAGAPAVTVTTARAEDLGAVWQAATRGGDAEVAEREYAIAMLDGDRALELAVAESQVARRRRLYLERAISAYERAAMARPEAAEPHFRAAAAIHAFYLECRRDEGASLCDGNPLLTSAAARVAATRAIDHWDAFEAKAPLDPRVTDEILFDRAILHTKLGTPEHLAAARADYRKILARRQLSAPDSIVIGNLAETEMMLGDLDQAIIAYRRTLQLEQSVSHYFGLAVALDRDEQGAQARAILRAFGPRGIEDLERQILSGRVFYVPRGEEFYYLALGYDAVGYHDEAIRFYDLFVASGAHPQFAPRARANRAAVAARRPAPGGGPGARR